MHHAGVAIAGRIHPSQSHSFSVMLGCEKAVDDFFPGFRRVVIDEVLNLFGGGGQSGEVKSDPTNKRSPIGIRLGVKPLRLQAPVDEVVQVFNIRLLFRRNERPVVIIFSSFGNPGLESLDLLGGEGLVCLGRRHEILGILGFKAGDEFTLGNIPGRQHTGVQGVFTFVEAKVSLGLAWSMAFEAGVREDGSNIAVEVNCCEGKADCQKGE